MKDKAKIDNIKPILLTNEMILLQAIQYVNGVEMRDVLNFAFNRQMDTIITDNVIRQKRVDASNGHKINCLLMNCD